MSNIYSKSKFKNKLPSDSPLRDRCKDPIFKCDRCDKFVKKYDWCFERSKCLSCCNCKDHRYGDWSD